MQKNQNQHQIEVLNDLIKINNDRVEGYRKASENLQQDNAELQPLFREMANESIQNKNQLIAEVQRLGGTPEEGTTTGGTLYRAWMDVKAVFGGDTPKSILQSCETGEDAAKNAYNSAIESSNLSECISIIGQQRDKQLQSHNQIKSLRDRYQA